MIRARQIAINVAAGTREKERKEDFLELDGEIEVISAPVYSRAEHSVGRTL